jgi:hypothetical protein
MATCGVGGVLVMLMDCVGLVFGGGGGVGSIDILDLS